MRIFLTGVSCVGKTTIGEKLAHLLDSQFVDVDYEIEKFFGTSIERLQNRFFSVRAYQKEASKALENLLLFQNEFVLALPPSGLIGSYWKLVKNASGTIIVLRDKPENILKRLVFFDIDSNPLEKKLSKKEEKLYLKAIRKDINYYNRSYGRADIRVRINGAGPDESVGMIMRKIRDKLSI